MARRALILAALVAASVGCRLDPEGSCDSRADCPAGLDCLNQVCTSCRSDADCGWSHLECTPAGLCEPRPGRCWVDADCPSWESCVAYTCALRSDHCADDARCAGSTPPKLCDGDHHCSFEAGRCATLADCPKWMASCDATGWCLSSTTAGEDVLALGTLVEGDCAFGAISRATTAAASGGVELGFDCGSGLDSLGWIDPVTGTVIYRHVEAAGGDVLRAFRKDAMTRDTAAGRWVFPADATNDDDLALAPGHCPIAWDRWIMQAGTGKLMYACAVTGVVRDFYDDADVRKLQAVKEALSWNDGGYVLVLDGLGAVKVVDALGVATAVTGLPEATHLAHRATATGFRVALRETASLADELWAIDELTAGATFVGTYASVPSAYDGDDWKVLDTDGVLYGGAYLAAREVVLKRPLTPGTTAEVYSGWSMPSGSNDFTATTFKPFVQLDKIFLITRP
jgi:hypothetical protein